MGFRTLAIERRSSEVWAVLGAIKTEFGKFGEVLEATRRKLEQASRSIESAGVRTRQIERKLKRRRGAAGGRGTTAAGRPRGDGGG
jgi:DNA recombination protein RmuC